MRWQIRQQRPVAYDVVEAPGLLEPDNPALLGGGRGAPSRRFVVLDEQFARHHGERVRAWFVHRGITTRIVEFPGGENNKSLDAWAELARELDAFPIHRRDEPVIAMGGGVLTDVVASVAASYRRGVPHIKVPTTLMGYVDAAIGIKCGINFNGHKNRLGSFEPPLQVLLDRSFLVTVPYRHLLNGMCEIIKLAVIADAGLFDLLEQHGTAAIASRFQDEAGAAILNRAIDGMLRELTPNLHEDELARAVDFGHTFSPGLENRHGPCLLHGEAVLLDILVSVHLARARGLLSTADAMRINALVTALGITPDTALLDADLMWHSLLERVEHRNGLQRSPLPVGIGQCRFVNDITLAEITAATQAVTHRTRNEDERILEC